MTSPELLNLTILSQLAQLEGRIPGFLKNQLTLLEAHWPNYIKSIQDVISTGDIAGAGDIFHKMRGHVSMVGMGSLSERLGTLEYGIAAGSRPEDWNLLVEELNELKTRSLEAARVFAHQIN